MELYNCLTDAWSTASLKIARGLLAAASLSVPSNNLGITTSVVMFAGGTTSAMSIFFSTVDIYDGKNWTTSQLDSARYSLAAATLDPQGLVVFAGGEDSACTLSVLHFYFL